MAGTGTTVKICGLQSIETVKSMYHLPVDHIGLVFAKSRRQVTAEAAGQIIRAVKRWEADQPPLVFGVFVNPSLEELRATIAAAPLDVVQLHGQESPEMCRLIRETFGVQVYKVFAAPNKPESGDLSETPSSVLEPYADAVDGFFLDTAGGGTGRAFDWRLIPGYAEWAREHKLPLIVAGGLHPHNVGELIQQYHPDGVDVSSGVETDGAKDINKIKAFVERVKQL